ncbi:DUF4192 domain-containing protein [Streptomyces sp. JJ66]|uniref:DUF4192 domain-containing protein n=1 Tax=Streptomyces sp. JJ66 TaxID=2803843 RepID=UPI001C57DC62|nr:DUF4192 domain-containing protein [Streptomyces sp. JJ66]MBW1600829.1 DUF4192 domain-containing protein [Streptomyces sp. JJ66]
MTHNDRPLGHLSPLHPSTEPHVTLRGPGELADALPYLLGYHPDDSIVLVAVHGESGRFGGRIRVGIPSVRQEWSDTAQQVAECLRANSTARGDHPDGAVLYLCREPDEGEPPQDASERLRPLARELRTACEKLGMPVHEALCISGGRYFSYCCSQPACCPPTGSALAPPGASPMAAAAAYAGIRVQGSLKDLTARLTPLGPPRAGPQEQALDAAGSALLPRMLGEYTRDGVRSEVLGVTERLLARFRTAPPGAGPGTAEADARDDAALADEEAATLIVGLQDRVTRDRAAEWMEGADAEPALRLWRAVSRRCVGAYVEYAAAPLTLAGWVAWSSGDATGARVALGQALQTDPGCVFARLLHSACNSGLDPEPLRSCLRGQRAANGAAHRGWE